MRERGEVVRHQRLARGALALAMLALMSGCTDSVDAPAASSLAPSYPAVKETPSGEIQQPPDLEAGWKGVLSDVTIDSCPTEAGRVKAKGTAVNSADETRDITIVISWNAPDSTNSLLQLAVAEEALPAGETVKWAASGELPSQAGQCVVLARSGKLAED